MGINCDENPFDYDYVFFPKASFIFIMGIFSDPQHTDPGISNRCVMEHQLTI